MHAPAAGDLQKISTALKRIPDLERIGDRAANIAEWPIYAPHRRGPDPFECAEDIELDEKKKSELTKNQLALCLNHGRYCQIAAIRL